MFITCPSCNLKTNIESFLVDSEARDFMITFAKLPKDIQPYIFRYLAVFRPRTGYSLQWKKAKRLTEELIIEISKEYIQQKGKVARPCNSKRWADGIDRIIGNPPSNLPLKTDGYLKTIVYGLADETDKIHEKVQIKAERNQKVVKNNEKPEHEISPITQDRIKALRDAVGSKM